ncbi:uncharacterized protein LOC116254641 [Nymphaea colorata]|nr:uncharacterized protein LOC116254641 [Nymphaea colorata]
MAGHQHAAGSVSGSSSGQPHFVNSPFGDTTYTKVFVGGLAWETQSEALRRHFEQYGEILEAVVITDKNTGRSKGYGFVTFRDPESARKAWVDPSPVIDGRRANCNLASLGRPRPSPPYGRLRSGGPYHGGVQGARVAIVRSPTYQQPVPYGYQQGYAYPSYGYAYGPEYLYAQNIYPYMGHPYLPLYGAPGTFNAPVYPVSQLSHQLPGGHSYAAVQGYAVPGHQVIQLSGPNVNGVTTSPVPAIPAPFPAGIASPLPAGQPHFLVPAHSPQFTQGTSGSDQTAS